MASFPSSLALLGPPAAVAAAAASKTAAPRQQGGREEDGDGGGKGSGEVAGQQPQSQQQPQQLPSLVLRLANPQITLLRLRVAAENATSTAESDSDGNTAAAAAAAVGVDETSPPGAEQSAGGGGDEVRQEGRAATSASSGSPATGTTAAAATALVAGGANAGFVTVRPAGWGEGAWVHLEGREDEIIRQPGDRYRLPRGLLSRAEQSGRTGATPFLLHQQGDVAWVRVPLDKACADRVSAAVKATAEALPVVDVRFSLVMGEGEGGGGDDVSMPIAVRFPLSSCPA